LEPLFLQAERAGVARRVLLAATGLPEEIAHQPHSQIPYDAVTALWREAALRTGDAAFGVHAAEGAPPGVFDVTEYAAVSSATLRDALLQVCRYQRLLTEVATYELCGEVLRLRYALGNITTPPSRHASEYLLACVLQKARHATGVAAVPLAVCFRHAAAPEQTEQRRFFAAPLHFSADSDELRFTPATLALPLLRADARLRSVLTRHAEDLLAKLPQQDRLSARVGKWISQTLQRGTVTLSSAARHFGVPVRRLQHQLRSEGETFESLLDRARHSEALRLLIESRLPIAEISYLLGFSQPSAFHRAFKRWTGRTAASYRTSDAPSSD
jgi:AraC-like DNA-binding protein